MFHDEKSRSSRLAAGVVQYAEAGPFGWIYAIGRIEAMFPSEDVEREFRQLAVDENSKGQTTFEQLLYDVLSKPENLFLTREMAWCFKVECVPTYLVRPRSDVELKQLVEAINPAQNPSGQVVYDVIIGAEEPIPPPGASHGNLPWVTVNRLFHFTAIELLQKVPVPKGANPQTFQAQVAAVFNDMLQLADNTGDRDEHRALNYVCLNYPDIYALSWTIPTNPPGGSLQFTGVDVRHSDLSRARTIIDVIFKYTDTSSSIVTRYYTAVDVTGQFPFLVSKLQPWFDR